ncbi:hypothetical protein [Streptomyces sp. NPDC047928]|uniref:hypothetical protein n=1 Tax=unclassified Streptomyces TaxID=2593676 RepID=UPI00371E17D8
MRPQRFADFVVGVVKNSPTATRVQTLADAGDTRHPFGVVITTTGEAVWQFVGQLPEGEKHETFEDTPVTGPPAAGGADAQPSDDPEPWLAAALARAACPEIAAIERWSQRPEPGSQPGLTVTFHNGARVFARVT